MKKLLLITLSLLGMAALLQAQSPAPDPSTEYTPEQLDELVAPIALYPDPLVALILPAAAAPTDIVLASRYLAGGGDPAQVSNQSWDDSVKALANYPDVIQWMNDNLDWTTALGRAFVQQQVQVMESIQQLRAQAQANGTLVNTPQQNVVMADSDICIFPTQPDTLYVPQYDPDLVFGDDPLAYGTPLIIFGPACPVGPWLTFECDWDDCGIWIGPWQRGWAYRRDWRQAQHPANARFWLADPVRQRAILRNLNRPVPALPQARPMAGAPSVANRPAQGFHPGAASSSRTDFTGWRAPGAAPRVATPPPATNRTGPSVVEANRPAVTDNRPPAPNRPAPTIVNNSPGQGNAIANRTPPATPIRTEPITTAPRAPVVTNRPELPRVTTPPPAGPAFGGYTRGSEANDYSNRGQASRQSAGVSPRPEPAPAPRAAPEARPAPVAPQRSEPSEPSGPNPNQRNGH